MDEQQEPVGPMLLLAAGASGLGLWWILSGRIGLGIAWFAVAVAYVATWYVRGRPGPTPEVGTVLVGLAGRPILAVRK
jgi:hypothetical protein